MRPKTSKGWALSFLQTRVTLSEHGRVAFPFSTRVGGSVCGPPPPPIDPNTKNKEMFCIVFVLNVWLKLRLKMIYKTIIFEYNI